MISNNSTPAVFSVIILSLFIWVALLAINIKRGKELESQSSLEERNRTNLQYNPYVLAMVSRINAYWNHITFHLFKKPLELFFWNKSWKLSSDFCIGRFQFSEEANTEYRTIRFFTREKHSIETTLSILLLFLNTWSIQTPKIKNVSLPVCLSSFHFTHTHQSRSRTWKKRKKNRLCFVWWNSTIWLNYFNLET